MTFMQPALSDVHNVDQLGRQQTNITKNTQYKQFSSKP